MNYARIVCRNTKRVNVDRNTDADTAKENITQNYTMKLQRQ